MHGQQSLRVNQQIINAQVKTQDGQQLGQIEDLIANPQTGKIEFAVVSKGDKLCPIPMQLLQPQGGAQTSTTESPTTTTTPGTASRAGAQAQKVTFLAQVDRQKLEQAPSFSRTQWPEISSTWTQQIYSHYGVQPEAAGGTSSSSSSTQGKSSSSSTTSDPSKSSSSSDTEKRSKDKPE
jgi:sporulation protein YlmC with PRC-barrel domain